MSSLKLDNCERTQSSKASHNQETLSTTDEINELGSRKLDGATNDGGQDGSGTGKGEEHK